MPTTYHQATANSLDARAPSWLRSLPFLLLWSSALPSVHGASSGKAGNAVCAAEMGPSAPVPLPLTPCQVAAQGVLQDLPTWLKDMGKDLDLRPGVPSGTAFLIGGVHNLNHPYGPAMFDVAARIVRELAPHCEKVVIALESDPQDDGIHQQYLAQPPAPLDSVKSQERARRYASHLLAPSVPPLGLKAAKALGPNGQYLLDQVRDFKDKLEVVPCGSRQIADARSWLGMAEQIQAGYIPVIAQDKKQIAALAPSECFRLGKAMLFSLSGSAFAEENDRPCVDLVQQHMDPETAVVLTRGLFHLLYRGVPLAQLTNATRLGIAPRAHLDDVQAESPTLLKAPCDDWRKVMSKTNCEGLLHPRNFIQNVTNFCQRQGPGL